MDTQTIISDWVLKIESETSDIHQTYTKNELDASKPLYIEGLIETEKIWFTYKLDESEKNCNLLIPRCKDKIKRENSVNAQTYLYLWTPINFAGVFDVILKIQTKNDEIRKFLLRLDVSSKFDNGTNKKNFYFLLNSLRKKHLEIYSLFNPSRIPKSNTKNFRSDPREQFKVLENNMGKLENIVYQISINPNKKLIKEIRRDKFYALDTVDHNVIYDIATHRGGLTRSLNEYIAPELQEYLKDTNGNNKYLPDNVLVYRTTPTYNVFENQLLKRFLTLITLCTKQIESGLAAEKCGKLEKKELEELDNFIQKCREIHKKAQYMKKYSFFDEVQETDNIAYHTPVLQREFNYMRFYDIFKDFIKMSPFDFSDNLNLRIVDMPTLYEYWVVIQIVDILSNLQGWEKELHFIQENELGFLFRLKSGNNSLIDLSNCEKQVSLFYQKEYSTYAERRLRPDITLEMQINGKIKILVLDPKYRSNLGAKDSNDPESAINKMHVYKDAIRGKNRSHIIKAAYAIFLGKDEPQNYKEIGIGGIRLFPNENETAGIENLKDIVLNFINN